jgi:hypothetical protein
VLEEYHRSLRFRRFARPRGCFVLLALLMTLPCGTLPASAGECVDATNRPVIVRMFSTANPDSLGDEQKYDLSCLTQPVYELIARHYSQPPSWRLLRNTRREYRELGRMSDLVAAVQRMAMSHDFWVRRAANEALILYGQPVPLDTLRVSCSAVGRMPMILAVVGDTAGVGLAICAFPTAQDKAWLLDAMYYQSTASALHFIARTASEEADPVLRERAKWMLSHPLPKEETWRF